MSSAVLYIPIRGVLLSVFAAVCLPVCANTAVPETRATVFATHTDTAVSVFATHHGARIWPRAGHSRPRPAHGTHRRPSLARRPTRLGRASAGRRARPAPSPTWWRWSLPPRRRVLSGRRGGWWCSTRAHARYSRAPRAYFGWAGDRPRSSRSLLRVQTRHCVGSDAWDTHR